MAESDREHILQSVREALRPLREQGLPAPYPDYELSETVSPKRLEGGASWETFQRNLESVHGCFLKDPPALKSYLQSRNAFRGYCDPALALQAGEILGDAFTLETTFDRDRVDDYAFGITRAAFAIAETGSIILHDRGTAARLGALAPWIHIAWISRKDLIPSLAEAVSRLGDDPNIVFVTGPSKTADVESVIVEGVHGPGDQAVFVTG